MPTGVGEIATAGPPVSDGVLSDAVIPNMPDKMNSPVMIERLIVLVIIPPRLASTKLISDHIVEN